MNVELSQYYNSLVDKDADRVTYYFDVVAVNKTSNIQNTICSIAQNPKKATGAERFKELVTKAESQKYDVLKVKEYGADGQTVVNNFAFALKSGNGRSRSRNRNLPAVQQTVNQYETLEGFESALGKLGYVNGFDGVIAASAEKMNQQFVLNQQQQQIADLKSENATLKMEKESLKKETEQYKERYKEILDEKKEMERDHKYEIQSLNQKLGLGSLAVNGALNWMASQPKAASILAGLFGGNGPVAPGMPAQPASAPAPAASTVDDDDDDGVTPVSTDPNVQKYLNFISSHCASLNAQDVEKVATIIQFVQIPGNLDYLTAHCKQKYRESQIQQQNGSNN